MRDDSKHLNDRKWKKLLTARKKPFPLKSVNVGNQAMRKKDDDDVAGTISMYQNVVLNDAIPVLFFVYLNLNGAIVVGVNCKQKSTHPKQSK